MATTTPSKPPLILGSASPRRRKILERITADFQVKQIAVDELHDATDPVYSVTHNALLKYEACRKHFADAAIITADTLVWFNGRLIGKPVTLAQAEEFLTLFSGNSQIVFTAVAMGLPQDKKAELRVAASSVHFKVLTSELIRKYLRRTRPLDRAGAYDIDENGELLIERWSGSYSNIMGMPLGCVTDWLHSRSLC
jgi:septum formation protein